MEQEINIDLGRTKKVDITVDCHISLLTIITIVETEIKNQKLKMNKVKTIVLNSVIHIITFNVICMERPFITLT